MRYHRPTTLSDALKVLEAEGVTILAGGTDIFPALAGAELTGGVLDITGIPEIAHIKQVENGWHFGAACTWAQVAKASLPSSFAALRQAAGLVGSPQIQNSGTLGGNLCNASPAADGVPPLLVLDAEVEIKNMHGMRRVPLQEFLLGVRKIDLAKGELLTGIFIPNRSTAGVSVFEKLGARAYLVISILMVAVRLEINHGIITDIAISVGASTPVAKRMSNLETAFIGLNINKLGDLQVLIQTHILDALQPIDDIRSSAEYREQAAVELIQRSVHRAIKAVV